MDLQRGMRVGEYEVGDPIGEGGFGIVYAGVHPEIGKRVAIKVLNKQASQNEEIVQRFRQEARAVNEIGHPNIIDIFAFGALPDGRLYFVMEMLEGQTLDKLVRSSGGRLAPDELLPILRVVAEAVDTAHTRGVVHRDLKPDNIFIVGRAGGRRDVKVLDFGIAKLAESSIVSTKTGTSMGTPLYMSPEQCFGRGVDHRTDVYAFGVLAFNALTGRYPIEAASLVEVVGKHYANDRRTPSQVGASPALDGPIMRCLASDPAMRFDTLGEACRALEQALVPGAPLAATVVRADRAEPAPAASPQTTMQAAAAEIETARERPAAKAGERTRRGWLVAGAGVAVAGAATAAVILAGGGSGSDPATRSWSAEKAKVQPEEIALVTEPVAPVEPPPNAWIHTVAGSPRTPLGVPAGAPEEVSGFRPESGMQSPTEPYFIQQHEVTWQELEASEPFQRWLEQHASERVARPSGAGDREPAVGLTWTAARAYCAESFPGGDLPSEEQWEYAARGPSRSPYPWGLEAIDLAATNVYRGPEARLAEVMMSPQDRTGGVASGALFDLLGNAREWTRDLYRDDRSGAIEDWVENGGARYAIRGLPLDSAPPAKLPDHALAFRSAACGAGECLAKSAERRLVGFRCVKAATTEGAP